MIINMTTIAVRQKMYIDRTLESLLRSDGAHLPVNLILGSSDTSHVEKYRGRFNIVVWDADAEAQARAGRMRHNCNVNAIRSLRYGDDEYCLCCEDDINFVENWYTQLRLTIAEIEDEDYVLNLGHGHDQSPDKRYATHTQQHLCGAQGIFYPSKALRDVVATYLEANIYASTNDDLVGMYAKQHAALYNTTPPLVHHIGQTSSFTQPKPEKTEAPVVPRPRPRVAAPVAAPVPDVRRDTAATLSALLRASLGTGDVPVAERLAKAAWRDLSLLASHHGLSSAVYRVLRDRNVDVPAERLRRFKAEYAANAFNHQLARSGLDEIGAGFGTARIPFVLLEGAALLRFPERDAGLGTIECIGALVDGNDVGRADVELQRLGYERRGSGGPPHTGEVRRLYYRPLSQSVPVELRWRLFEPYLPYFFDEDAVRTEAKPVPGSSPRIVVPAPEHELAYLCLQLDRRTITYRSLIHQDDWAELLLLSSGARQLGRLYEIALYVQEGGARIDWPRFVDTARRWAIDARLHATFELSQRMLGVAPPAEVLRQLDHGGPPLVERIAHRIAFASERAAEDRQSGSARKRRWLAAYATPLLRTAQAWVSVFPPRAHLRAKYPHTSGALPLHGRHLRDLVPALWSEARYRLGRAH